MEKVPVSLMVTVLTFNISLVNRNKLTRILKTAEKIICQQQKQLDDIRSTAVRRKALSINKDRTHSLYPEFEVLSSGWHCRIPLAETKLYNGNYFSVPHANTVID